MERSYHTFGPVFSDESKVLILGSFPSVRSREQGFYYAHPQNRFWKVLAFLFGEALPQSIDEKRCFISDHKLALWDVASSCEIKGSADSSLKYAEPNDIAALLKCADIKNIFTNGKTAQKLYDCCFTSPIVSNKGNFFSRLYFEIEIFQNRLVTAFIGKADITELNFWRISNFLGG